MSRELTTKRRALGVALATTVALTASLMGGPAGAEGNGAGNGAAHGKKALAAETAISSDGVIESAPATGLQGVESFAGDNTSKGPEVGADRPDRRPLDDNGTETIIGTDNRVLVNPTTSYPARAVALITFSVPGGTASCTGWMIGRDTVATAGHCLAPGGTGGFYPVSSYRVFPARNGSTSPYGSCTARRLHSVAGWVTSGNEEYDYGAVKLNCTVGYSTGWFGFFWQSASLTGQTSIINGYPGDKPQTQWRSTDSVRISATRQLFYLNDTVGGMSGAPVYNYRVSGSAYCSGYCAMAVHAYGLHGSYPHSSHNHGSRITEGAFNNLVNWRNAA